jgi:hypothetical protein
MDGCKPNLPPPQYRGDEEVFFCEPYDLGGVTAWRFWCDCCREWHSHGAGEGLRVSHCTDSGRKHGKWYRSYYLKLHPRFEVAR